MTCIWTLVLTFPGWLWYAYRCETLKYPICDSQALRESSIPHLTASFPCNPKWSQEPCQFTILVDSFLSYLHWHRPPFKDCLGIIHLPMLLTLESLPLPLLSIEKLARTLIQVLVTSCPLIYLVAGNPGTFPAAINELLEGSEQWWGLAEYYTLLADCSLFPQFCILGRTRID